MSKPDILELSRSNTKKAEHDIVLAMFNSMISTSPIIDKFSMWLFAGTGATGALLITQINSVLSSMSIAGFKVCMLMLIVSSIFAFIAKFFSLVCQINSEAIAMITEKIEHIIKNYAEKEKVIEQHAKEHGVDLETNISIENIMKEYHRPFPIWIRWMANYSTKKTEGDSLAPYHSTVQAGYKQSIFTFLQAVMFIGFMCSGWYYAGSSMQ